MENHRAEEEILTVKGLSVSFTQYDRGFRRKEIQAVTDLDLRIRSGEIVAVVGASGSGKSLLAHAVMGILPYNASMSGEILFKGTPLTRERVRRLRGRELVLVPQSVTYLDPLMKTGQQLTKGRKNPEILEKCKNILCSCGLGLEVMDKYPFQLSGGMARRVLISTAAMEDAELVIADEPTPGLDKETAMGVMDHFRQMAERGAGVLLITHDLELAVRSADRVTVLYGGRTVEETEASSFLDESLLKHPYTKALCRSMPGKWPSADTLEDGREGGIPDEGILEYMRKEYGR